jgi:hypothetical protein
MRVTGAILLGAAAASAGAGGAFAWRASDDADQLSTWVRDGNMWNNTAAEIDRDGQRAELLSRVFLGTAVVAAAVGLFLLARGERP